MLSKLLIVHYFKVLEEKDLKCAVITTHSGFIKTAGRNWFSTIEIPLKDWNKDARWTV